MLHQPLGRVPPAGSTSSSALCSHRVRLAGAFALILAALALSVQLIPRSESGPLSALGNAEDLGEGFRLAVSRPRGGGGGGGNATAGNRSDLGARCQKTGHKLVCLPNVLFIGASKCGTSSLRSHLVAHPGVRFVRRPQSNLEGAEVHRFDRATYSWSPHLVELALEWGHSPAVDSPRVPVVHYTPHYLWARSVPVAVALFYPHAPQLRFLVTVREPVSRAISSFWFKQPGQRGGTAVKLAKVVDAELAWRRRIDACLGPGRDALAAASAPVPKALLDGVGAAPVRAALERLKVEHERCDLPYRTNPHVDKGLYAVQLRRWFEVFPQQNFLVTALEEFNADAEGTFTRICAFLGVDAVGASGFPSRDALLEQMETKFNVGHNPDVEPPLPETVAKLRAFYAPHNEALFRMLGRTLPWDTRARPRGARRH